jgi:hypothetical protein
MSLVVINSMSNRSINSNIKRQIGLCSIELHKTRYRVKPYRYSAF